MAEDEAIQETNDDATACKKCAVELGYWKDEYVPCFMKSAERRAPEINRGYYARVQGCLAVVDSFLSAAGSSECQIVSLGAGFDTLYWRLHSMGKLPKCFYEVDVKPVVARKALSIRNKRKLNECLVEANISGSGVASKLYHLVGADIRDTPDLEQRLIQAGMDPVRPTLLLAECVLTYLRPEESSALLQWASKTYPSAVFLNYEPVNLGDRFGQIMRTNLKTRGCSLLGGLACQSLDDQKSRFLTNGWSTSGCLSMTDVYRLLPADDVKRIEKLEFLDETELLQQLLDHYCFSWAVNDTTGLGFGGVVFGTSGGGV